MQTAADSFGDGKVQVTVDDEGLATITLASPPANSLTGCVLSGMSETIDVLNKNSSVKGIIITSSLHGRNFSSGLNFPEILDKSDAQVGEYWRRVQNWHLNIYGCGKPVVAAVNGFAQAGGCALALMADYRIIMEGTTIGLNSTSFSASSPKFWADLTTATIGKRQAELALLQGTMFSSREALKIGLVDEVCDADMVYKRARKQLLKMAKIPQPAYMLTKQLFRAETIQDLVKNKEAETAQFVGFINQPAVQAKMKLAVAMLT